MILHMATQPPPAERTGRVIRPGDPIPPDGWWHLSMGERIEAVWILTLACLAWTEKDPLALRLQRSVVRTQRPGS